MLPSHFDVVERRSVLEDFLFYRKSAIFMEGGDFVGEIIAV